jgi:pseudaminic acid synthase
MLGASVIEKHFISGLKLLADQMQLFHWMKAEFTQMVKAVRGAQKAIGKVSYELTEKQQSGKQFSRSLYVSKDVKKGDVITKENVRSVRPGYGLHPKHLEEVLGKTFNFNLKKGEPLDWKHFN